MTVVVKLLVLMLLPVASEPDATAAKKPSQEVARSGKKACSLADEDYPRLLTQALRDLTKRQVRKKGEPVDFVTEAKHLSRMISLGLPAAELDRQLWKDITDHRRYQGGAKKGAGVGTTLADEGSCTLHADQYAAYYLGRARLQYHRRIARAGCSQARAFREAHDEHAAWLKAVGCRAKPAKEEVKAVPEKAKTPEPKASTKAEPAEGTKAEPAETKKAAPAEAKKAEPAEAKKAEPEETKKAEPAEGKKAEPEESKKAEPETPPKPIPEEPKKAKPAKKKPPPIEAVPQREMEDDF